MVGVRVFGVPPSVAHHADHGSHQQEEGGASRSPSDQGDVGGLKGPVLVATTLATKVVGSSRLGGVPCTTWKRSQSYLSPQTVPLYAYHKNTRAITELRFYISIPIFTAVHHNDMSNGAGLALLVKAMET